MRRPPRVATHPFDYVIAGGGTAGCVLANRLSADPSVRVLLVEAGPPDHRIDPRLHLPLALGFPVGNPRYDWRSVSEPEPGLGGRRLEHPRGKVLGGSSSINGLIYQRGNAADYDRWAEETGTRTWDHAHCLPYFRRIEACMDEPSGTGRGRRGPQSLQRGPADGPIFAAFFAAARQSGYAVVPDLNDDAQDGFSPLDQTVHHGRRASAAAAYLRPARSRPNLTVACNTHVAAIVFEGRRAVGLRLRDRRGTREVRGTEVILSAGAIGSPQLLQVSGVGDTARLEALGIPVVHDLPGVGAGLQDHLAVHVQHACRQPVSMAAIRRPARWPGLVLDALVFGRGPAARNPMQAGGFVRGDLADGAPARMFLLSPLTFNTPGASGDAPEHGYQMHVGVMRSSARGSVSIVSPDPRVSPRVVLNFLTGPQDETRWVDAVRRARALLGRPAFEDLDAGETAPGPAVRTDEEIVSWVRRHARPGWHVACSLRMGHDPDSVVDPATLRVHGLDGLRVVDASVMPSLVNANTLASTMLIAEKAADAVLGNSPPLTDAATPGTRTGH